MFENIRNHVNAPSVQMQAVPSISVGQALGMSRAVQVKSDDPDDEVDERIRGVFQPPWRSSLPVQNPKYRLIISEHFRRRDQPYADSDDSDSELGEPRDARRRGHINAASGRRTLPSGTRGNSRLNDPCGTEHGSESGEGRIKSKRRRFFKATGLQTGLNGNLTGLSGTGSATGYATPVGDTKTGQTRNWLAGLTNGQSRGNGNGNGNGNGTVLEWGAGGAGLSRAASPMSVV